MAGRHLRELLSEEQEPFALQRFIDERRRHGKAAALPSTPRQSHRHFHLTKSPLWPGSRAPAAILVGSASRVPKLGKKNQRFFQRRRKRRRSIEEDSRRSFGLSFLATLFNRLVLRKQRHRVIRGQEEEEDAEDAVEEEKMTSEKAQKKNDDQEEEDKDLQSVEPTPPASPTRRTTKENLVEEKEEQCSPVSVLDPPPSEEEDDDAQEKEEEDDDEASSFHSMCASRHFPKSLLHPRTRALQSSESGGNAETKRDLLRRIRRFESLADLDPPQLDWRLAGEHEEDDPGKLGFQRGLEEIVEMDMKREESDEWRRFPDQVVELAVVFSSLLASELAEDFIQTLHLD